jgi:hypothetical protein
MTAKLRNRLSVSKRAAQSFICKDFILGKLNFAEVKKEFQIKISNRFADLENLEDNVDINWARTYTGA